MVLLFLLNDMLTLTIDTIIQPNKRFNLKFLHKVIKNGGKKTNKIKTKLKLTRKNI